MASVITLTFRWRSIKVITCNYSALLLCLVLESTLAIFMELTTFYIQKHQKMPQKNRKKGVKLQYSGSVDPNYLDPDLGSTDPVFQDPDLTDPVGSLGTPGRKKLISSSLHAPANVNCKLKCKKKDRLLNPTSTTYMLAP